MAGIYSSVARKKKNNSLVVAIVLAVVVLVLLVFIIWCAANFSGDGYKNTTQEVSEMKMLLTERDAQISALKEQIVKLEEQNREYERALSSSMSTPVMPEPAPSPTPTPLPDEE